MKLQNIYQSMRKTLKTKIKIYLTFKGRSSSVIYVWKKKHETSQIYIFIEYQYSRDFELQSASDFLISFETEMKI